MRDRDESAWHAPGCQPVSSPALTDALSGFDDAFSALEDVLPSGLADADAKQLLDHLTTSMSRVAALTARAAAEADRRRLGDEIGARHTAQWWANRSRLTRGEAAQLVRLGRALDEALHSPVGAALVCGEIHTHQADVIVRAVDDLPTDLADDTIRTRARDLLLADASQHDARALRILGRRILDVVAPQIGEIHEQRVLEHEEQAAAARARFTMMDDGHGRCHGRFSIPTLHGEMLRGHLYALANPRRHVRDDNPPPDDAAGAASGPVVTPDLLGQAFMEYIERYRADRLPESGGTSVTMTVTMSLEALISGVGAATLDSGARLSAGETRRLACGAGLVPAVLGTASQVLDLGRTARLFSRAQRRALALRDRGCTAEECGLPPSVCHAHHDVPWSEDGPSDLPNGRLLCPRHHRLAHDRRYDTTALPDGRIAFHRRT